MSTLQRVAVPILVFSLLSFTAVHFILRQSLVQSGLALKTRAICSGPSSYRLAYVNIPSADKFICVIVVFFQTVIDPSYHLQPHLATAFPVVGVLALISYLEAARNRPPIALRIPTLFLALSQIASAMPRIPLRKSTKATPKPSSLVLLLGYVLPTTLMLYLNNPRMTAIWQTFPLLFSLSIFVHKLIRPPTQLVHSGHPTVQITLVFTLVVSALLHVVYVWPVLTDSVTLWTMFVPNMGIRDPPVVSLADGVLQFMRWDLIFSSGPVMLATLWMADSMHSLVGILVWYSLATIALGPAAAITGVFLWRERRLNGQDKIPQKVE
ncbi:hypothetical protein JVU11DRAFT_200 [Chiua virens]|nr:hypothetical protein JVU11DRAFT_200 [Chiua virens]